MSQQQKLIEQLLIEQLLTKQSVRRLIAQQHKLIEELVTKQSAVLDQVLIKQHELNARLLQQYKAVFATGVASPVSAEKMEQLAFQAMSDPNAIAEASGAGILEDASEVDGSQAGSALARSAVGKGATAPAKGKGEKSSPQVKPTAKPKPVADDEVRLVSWKYLVSLGVLAIIACTFFGVQLASGPESPDRLAAAALSAGTKEERLKALRELAVRKDADYAPLLRKVAAESTDPDVLGDALQFLADRNDRASISLFLDSMERSPVVQVRKVASAAMQRVTWPFGEEIGYAPDDPDAKRAQAVQRLRSAFPGGKMPLPGN